MHESTEKIMFDPSKAENPESQPLTLMRPETGALVTPARARQERIIAEATTRRTTRLDEWGPKSKFEIDTPEGLTFSA